MIPYVVRFSPVYLQAVHWSAVLGVFLTVICFSWFCPQSVLLCSSYCSCFSRFCCYSSVVPGVVLGAIFGAVLSAVLGSVLGSVPSAVLNAAFVFCVGCCCRCCRLGGGSGRNRELADGVLHLLAREESHHRLQHRLLLGLLRDPVQGVHALPLVPFPLEAIEQPAVVRSTCRCCPTYS